VRVSRRHPVSTLFPYTTLFRSASCSMDGTIKLWNLQTMQEVCTITFDIKPVLGKEIGVQGVGFAPDGNSLWAFSRSGILKYWRRSEEHTSELQSRSDLVCRLLL